MKVKEFKGITLELGDTKFTLSPYKTANSNRSCCLLISEDKWHSKYTTDVLLDLKSEQYIFFGIEELRQHERLIWVLLRDVSGRTDKLHLFKFTWPEHDVAANITYRKEKICLRNEGHLVPVYGKDFSVDADFTTLSWVNRLGVGKEVKLSFDGSKPVVTILYHPTLKLGPSVVGD